MKTNVGKIDRIARLIIGAALILLSVLNYLNGTIGIVAIVAGVILVVTGAAKFCPIYRLLNISSGR